MCIHALTFHCKHKYPPRILRPICATNLQQEKKKRDYLWRGWEEGCTVVFLLFSCSTDAVGSSQPVFLLHNRLSLCNRPKKGKWLKAASLAGLRAPHTELTQLFPAVTCTSCWTLDQRCKSELFKHQRREKHPVKCCRFSGGKQKNRTIKNTADGISGE